MKGEDEVQRAHDILVQVVLGELPALHLSPGPARVVHLMADVLCWVLEHDHNDAFARNYQNLQDAIKEAGYEMEEAPFPMSREEWAGRKPS